MTTNTALLAQPATVLPAPASASPTPAAIADMGAITAPTIEGAAMQMISTLVDQYLADGTETLRFTLHGTPVEVGLDDTFRDVANRWKAEHFPAAARLAVGF
jgi:hypothetical protein